jgi:hypothetical protein
MAFAPQLHISTRLFVAVLGVLGLLVGVSAALVGSTALAAEIPVVPKLEFEATVYPIKPMKRPEPPVRYDAPYRVRITDRRDSQQRFRHAVRLRCIVGSLTELRYRMCVRRPRFRHIRRRLRKWHVRI